jgi:hypothetical protein
MLNAEGKCCRIKSGRIPSFPESALWIRHAQVYKSILQYHDGRIKNRGNLKQMARCCGIERCFSILVEEILLQLRVCIKSVITSEKTAKSIARSTSMTASFEQGIKTIGKRNARFWQLSKGKKIAVSGDA